MRDDCDVNCKEMERIETLVVEAKSVAHSVRDEFRSIITNKIYSPTTEGKLSNIPVEAEPANKLDRIILDLHRVINTLEGFKKRELADLETELSKL